MDADSEYEWDFNDDNDVDMDAEDDDFGSTAGSPDSALDVAELAALAVPPTANDEELLKNARAFIELEMPSAVVGEHNRRVDRGAFLTQLVSRVLFHVHRAQHTRPLESVQTASLLLWGLMQSGKSPATVAAGYTVVRKGGVPVVIAPYVKGTQTLAEAFNGFLAGSGVQAVVTGSGEGWQRRIVDGHGHLIFLVPDTPARLLTMARAMAQLDDISRQTGIARPRVISLDEADKQLDPQDDLAPEAAARRHLRLRVKSKIIQALRGQRPVPGTTTMLLPAAAVFSVTATETPVLVKELAHSGRLEPRDLLRVPVHPDYVGKEMLELFTYRGTGLLPKYLTHQSAYLDPAIRDLYLANSKIPGGVVVNVSNPRVTAAGSIFKTDELIRAWLAQQEPEGRPQLGAVFVTGAAFMGRMHDSNEIVNYGGDFKAAKRAVMVHAGPDVLVHVIGTPKMSGRNFNYCLYDVPAQLQRAPTAGVLSCGAAYNREDALQLAGRMFSNGRRILQRKGVAKIQVYMCQGDYQSLESDYIHRDIVHSRLDQTGGDLDYALNTPMPTAANINIGRAWHKGAKARRLGPGFAYSPQCGPDPRIEEAEVAMAAGEARHLAEKRGLTLLASGVNVAGPMPDPAVLVGESEGVEGHVDGAPVFMLTEAKYVRVADLPAGADGPLDTVRKVLTALGGGKTGALCVGVVQYSHLERASEATLLTKKQLGLLLHDPRLYGARDWRRVYYRPLVSSRSLVPHPCLCMALSV